MLGKYVIIVILASIVSFGVNAQKYQFVALDKSLETKLCVNVGNNDKLATRRAMSILYGNNYKMAANIIRCNDMSVAKFAFKYGALDTFKLVNRYSYYENKVKPKTSIHDIVKAVTDEDDVITVFVGAAPK